MCTCLRPCSQEHVCMCEPHLHLLPFLFMVFPSAKSNILSTAERPGTPSVPESRLQVKDSLIAVRFGLSTGRSRSFQQKTPVSKCTWKSNPQQDLYSFVKGEYGCTDTSRWVSRFSPCKTARVGVEEREVFSSTPLRTQRKFQC